MKFPTKKRRKPNVLLTPLIDIVFLLLVFFLLASNFVDQQGTSISMPQVESEGKELTPEVTVTIDEKGKLYFKDVLMNETILLKVLRNNLKKTIKKNVAIRADRQVKYDHVVRVIDIAKEAGAKDFILVTQRK